MIAQSACPGTQVSVHAQRMGSHVRLLSQGFLGQTAQIVELPTGPHSSQSGIVAPVADVQMADGQKLRVPLVDLEAIE